MIVARPLVESDLPAVLELLRADERRWFSEPLSTLDEVRAQWSAPDFDLGRDSEGWTDGDALVAFGTLEPRGGIELVVDESWAGAGLEDTVLDRWEAEARRRGLWSVHRDLSASDHEGRARLEGRGWVVEREGWLLALGAAVAVEERDLPGGYLVRPMVEADVGAAYAVVRDAFAPYGGPARSSGDWRAGRIERPDVTLEHCRVATWRGAVVGVCLVEDPQDDAGAGAGVERGAEAWVPQLAVQDTHRRRGVARALLASTTLAARARGVPRLALYTHADTGARGLYERFGMVVRQAVVECRLTFGG